MLQVDPPPKAVKVTMRKRVPLVGEELLAYEEEQNRIKKEEALKASLVKEEDLKTSHGSDDNLADPMVIDAPNNHVPSDGKLSFSCSFCCLIKLFVFHFYIYSVTLHLSDIVLLKN